MAKINKPAITVKAIANTVGSNNKVAITKMAKESNTTKITGGSPSRYIAKINALYTSANPISCCRMDKTAGSAMAAPAIKCDFKFLKSVSGLDINFARNKAVKILHNSAGCKLKPPAMGIQLLDPFIFLPSTKVASMSRMPAT